TITELADFLDSDQFTNGRTATEGQPEWYRFAYSAGGGGYKLWLEKASPAGFVVTKLKWSGSGLPKGSVQTDSWRIDDAEVLHVADAIAASGFWYFPCRFGPTEGVGSSRVEAGRNGETHSVEFTRPAVGRLGVRLEALSRVFEELARVGPKQASSSMRT